MTDTTKCGACRDTGHVCENHPGLPWTPALEDDWPSCACGAGMPCPCCTVTPPQDGTRSITAAFEPGSRRRLEDAIKRAERGLEQIRKRIEIGEQIIAKGNRQGGGPAIKHMVETERRLLAEAEQQLELLRLRLAA